MSRKIIVFSIFIATFLIDSLSKLFILNISPNMDNFNLDLGIISVTRIYNTGAAFGILKGWTSFLIIFSLLILIVLSLYVYKKHKELNILQASGLGMIMGGTAGNFFDRATFGYVIDFIKLNFIDFPVFNLADLFINIGVILILISLFSRKRDNH